MDEVTNKFRKLHLVIESKLDAARTKSHQDSCSMPGPRHAVMTMLVIRTFCLEEDSAYVLAGHAMRWIVVAINAAGLVFGTASVGQIGTPDLTYVVKVCPDSGQ